jgi:hypothetical protein
MGQGVSAWRSYCTLAVTEAVPLSVNVHVFDLFPPLEHAPDQIASRPFETLSACDIMSNTSRVRNPSV